MSDTQNWVDKFTIKDWDSNCELIITVSAEDPFINPLHPWRDGVYTSVKFWVNTKNNKQTFMMQRPGKLPSKPEYHDLVILVYNNYWRLVKPYIIDFETATEEDWKFISDGGLLSPEQRIIISDYKNPSAIVHNQAFDKIIEKIVQHAHKRCLTNAEVEQLREIAYENPAQLPGTLQPWVLNHPQADNFAITLRVKADKHDYLDIWTKELNEATSETKKLAVQARINAYLQNKKIDDQRNAEWRAKYKPSVVLEEVAVIKHRTKKDRLGEDIDWNMTPQQMANYRATMLEIDGSDPFAGLTEVLEYINGQN